MTSEIQQRNLQSLTAEFHDRGKASKGLKTIVSQLKRNEGKDLFDLLDHHDNRIDGYYGKELIQRFEIDALIEFYNLLIVGATAGYIPAHFGETLDKEMETVLGNKAMKLYYTRHYPYKLASYALAYAKNDRQFKQQVKPNSAALFNSFAALNRGIKKDKDIEIFLGMLDFVSYNGYNINHVIAILTDTAALQKSVTSKRKNEGDHGVMGFIKYTAFLSQLKSIMQAARGFSLLQSAMWMFYGYYFDRMNANMKKVFNTVFKNMQLELVKPQTLAALSGNVGNGDMRSEVSAAELARIINASIARTKEDVAYILDKKWGEPLKKFFGKK